MSPYVIQISLLGLLIGRPIRTDGGELPFPPPSTPLILRFLRPDSGEQFTGWLIIRVLRNELAANGEVENPSFESIYDFHFASSSAAPSKSRLKSSTFGNALRSFSGISSAVL